MAFGPPVPISKKPGLGCMGCGCGLLILVLLLIGALVYAVYHEALSITDATPASIPQADGGPTVYSAAQHKIGEFQQAIEHAKPATLRLSSDEINTYIARDSSMAAFRGRLFVRMQDSEATIQSSLPLGAVEHLAMTDRYVNCDATLSIAFDPQDKNLTVDLHNLSLKGQPMPTSSSATFSQAINSALARQIQANGPVRDFLSRTQKIAIENGELVIETK